VRTSQQLVLGVTGQTIYFDPPEGRPSSVTSVTVYEAYGDDTASAVSATTGSASIDSFSTTFSSASGASQANRELCNVTSSASAAVGRTYLGTNTNGATEWIEARGKATGIIYSRTPLQLDYAAADTIVGCRISISIDSTWVAATSNLSDPNGVIDPLDIRTQRSSALPFPRYRARWQYVVGGVSYVHDSNFDLVRYPAVHGVTGLDVDARYPGWLDTLPTDYAADQGARCIDIAFREVTEELLGDGKLLWAMRSGQIVDSLVIKKAVAVGEQAKLVRGGSSKDAVEATELAYGALYDRLIREPKVPFQSTSGGAAIAAVRLPLAVR